MDYNQNLSTQKLHATLLMQPPLTLQNVCHINEVLSIDGDPLNNIHVIGKANIVKGVLSLLRSSNIYCGMYDVIASKKR